MKRSLIAGMMAVALVISSVGCTSRAGTKTGETAGGADAKEEADYELTEAAKNHATDGADIIGISMPATNLERWNRDGALLAKNFEEAGYTVSLKLADNTVDSQIEDVNELIDEGIDVLVIATVNYDGLEDVLARAESADIPIIAYDRIIDSPAVDYYVSFDSYMVGQMEGEYIRDTLDLDHAGDNKFNLEIVSGYSADKNADGYYNGAMDVLQPYIDKGTLVVPSGQIGYAETETFQWKSEYANERMLDILANYYSDGKKLAAVLCANDSAAAGVADAIESSYKGKNIVLLTGQDGDEENLKNIMEDKQTMTVYKCLPNETEVMKDVTIAFMKGEEIDESLIEKSGWDFDVVYSDDRYSNGTQDM
ncbi:MAG: sugar-binding protein [Lachnospiraceae bacterium]|nr:sugar-binding protein [Lachnospiraceae bacterium]